MSRRRSHPNDILIRQLRRAVRRLDMSDPADEVLLDVADEVLRWLREHTIVGLRHALPEEVID